MSTFSLEQIPKTRNLDAKLILRQYKQNLISNFQEIKSIDPKLTKKQITKDIRYSDTTKKTIEMMQKCKVLIDPLRFEMDSKDAIKKNSFRAWD